MKLWGYQYDTEEQVPQYVPTDEKKNCYATDVGWIQLNNAGIEETLVCFKNLAGSNSSTGLGAPSVMEVNCGTRSTNSENVVLTVVYNEKVLVTGSPYITLSGNQAFAGNGWSYYTSGDNTNQLVFTYVPQATDNVSTITANTIVLNSGTIKDSSNTSAKLNFNAAGYNSATNVCPDLTGIVVVKP